mmetsp:Transcript_3467/g.9430  ORF Transcript_3467/g.9430 Transcript_3467/m.9430 type:complete len:250 (+) Transcript_3467:217-966(+)
METGCAVATGRPCSGSGRMQRKPSSVWRSRPHLAPKHMRMVYTTPNIASNPTIIWTLGKRSGITSRTRWNFLMTRSFGLQLRSGSAGRGGGSHGECASLEVNSEVDTACGLPETWNRGSNGSNLRASLSLPRGRKPFVEATSELDTADGLWKTWTRGSELCASLSRESVPRGGKAFVEATLELDTACSEGARPCGSGPCASLSRGGGFRGTRVCLEATSDLDASCRSWEAWTLGSNLRASLSLLFHSPS